MLARIIAWVRDREPVATAAALFAAVAVAGPAVADLPADASWTAVAAAAVMAVLRHYVTPAGRGG